MKDGLDSLRGNFPLSFGKSSKVSASIETIHNATRRTDAGVSSDLASKKKLKSGKDESGFPSLSSSSDTWLRSVRGPNRNPRSSSLAPSDDDVDVGPPPPPSKEEEEDDGVIMGPPPPRPPKGSVNSNDSDDDDDMIGPPPPPPPATIDSDEDSDDDDVDDSEENRYKIPLTNEIQLKGHTKIVSSLAVDSAGARVLSGSYDYTVRMYDFQGMNSRLQSFRQIEPSEGHQVRSVSWSPTSGQFLCVTGSAQAKIFDRDGLTLGEFMKGDMYIRDLKNTKGHICGLTYGEWNPRTGLYVYGMLITS